MAEGLGHLLDTYGLTAIFAVMLIKEIGLVGWMLMRRRARMQKQGTVAVTLERLGDWADASCPVCLAIGAVEYVRHRENAPA